METLLCAIDLSPFSVQVVDYALFLFSKMGKKLYLLHSVAKDSEVPIAEQQLHEFLSWIKERGFEEVEGLVTEGDPAEQISRYAEELKADLIVMGTRGLVSPETSIVSTAQKVITLVHTPILIVPTPFK
ncbi:MAG: universal stress protein [bacterium JZ-2024 1]